MRASASRRLFKALLLGVCLGITACATSKPPLSPAPDPERKKKRDSETIEHGPYALLDVFLISSEPKPPSNA